MSLNTYVPKVPAKVVNVQFPDGNLHTLAIFSDGSVTDLNTHLYEDLIPPRPEMSVPLSPEEFKQAYQGRL